MCDIDVNVCLAIAFPCKIRLVGHGYVYFSVRVRRVRIHVPFFHLIQVFIILKK
jgi:hypothetical protein